MCVVGEVVYVLLDLRKKNRVAVRQCFAIVLVGLRGLPGRHNNRGSAFLVPRLQGPQRSHIHMPGHRITVVRSAMHGFSNNQEKYAHQTAYK